MRHDRDPLLARVAAVPLGIALAVGAVSCGEASVAPPASTEASLTPSGQPIGAAPTTEAPSTPPSEIRKYVITFYGAADNDPAGSTAVAHPDIQPRAGGTGTYKNPLTFAVREGMNGLKPGARIYVPGVEKYFIFADDCTTSPSAVNGCATDLDLYVGNPSTSKAVLGCEDALTPDGRAEVVVNPPSDLQVNHTPLWDDATRRCGTASW
jgi:hypothetical protein